MIMFSWNVFNTIKCTDFTDFHGIDTNNRIKIRINPVKIREIRTSINPIFTYLFHYFKND
jgi:hypothetical protein